MYAINNLKSFLETVIRNYFSTVVIEFLLREVSF